MESNKAIGMTGHAAGGALIGYAPNPRRLAFAGTPSPHRPALGIPA